MGYFKIAIIVISLDHWFLDLDLNLKYLGGFENGFKPKPNIAGNKKIFREKRFQMVFSCTDYCCFNEWKIKGTWHLALLTGFQSMTMALQPPSLLKTETDGVNALKMVSFFRVTSSQGLVGSRHARNMNQWLWGYNFSCPDLKVAMGCLGCKFSTTRLCQS